MFRSVFICVCLLFSLHGSTILAQNEEDAVLGYWLTSKKEAIIQIYKCGDRYCGKLYWMKNPNNDDGTPKKDKENPEEELRDRHLFGLEILTDFEYDEDNEWEDGEIYDPESGNTYSCYMELSEDGQKLDVRGYIGISLLGRTETWTRTVPKDE